MDATTAFALGALVTLLSVVLGAYLQRTTEHRRWIRERRHHFYSEFVESAYQVIERGWDLDQAVGSSDEPLTVTSARPYLDALLQQGRHAKTVLRQLELVASPSIRERASEMAYSAEEFEWRVSHGGPTVDAAAWDVLITYETVDEFVQAARLELGADSRPARIVDWLVMRWRRLKWRIRQWGTRRRQGPAADATTKAPDDAGLKEK